MRVFVAIELPQAVRDRLRELQSRLAGLGRIVRWTRPEQIHLTIKFLGHVPDEQLAGACQMARRIAEGYSAFDLEVSGVGCFPPRGPVRIIWAGLADPPPSLFGCRQACEEAFAELGFEKENRPFRPHLTIGRVNDPSAGHRIREALRHIENFSAGRFTAEELVVFQSELRPTGAVYAPLAHAAFS